jgi:DNA repair exonuclease SbcCD ATPase subunit
LNERISEYLNVLSGGTIKAVIKTQKDLTSGGKSDKIDLVISNEQGADSYKGLSAGEKRRVDISISLALQDLVMKQSNLAPNLLMYDEVFENLDEVGCENVIELLKKRLDVAGSIIVISHSEHLKPLFNNVITVVKENGLSTLK